ncbi:MAG: hypothetical protein ABL907_01510 [Hyphomicrobium sp.]
MRAFLVTLLMLLPFFATGATAAPAHAATPVDESQCWANWSAAAPIVHKEALRPAAEVRALAQTQGQGQLLTITLCSEQGRFVYRLLILKTAGTVEALTVDARKPFGR